MWGTAAGSDGDSMPESPLSLDDGRLNSLNSYSTAVQGLDDSKKYCIIYIF